MLHNGTSATAPDERFGVREIDFWDDLFIASKPRFKRIADLIEERGISKKVEFGLLCRANLVDEDIIDYLKKKIWFATLKIFLNG